MADRSTTRSRLEALAITLREARHLSEAVLSSDEERHAFIDETATDTEIWELLGELAEHASSITSRLIRMATSMSFQSFITGRGAPWLNRANEAVLAGAQRALADCPCRGCTALREDAIAAARRAGAPS